MESQYLCVRAVAILATLLICRCNLVRKDGDRNVLIFRAQEDASKLRKYLNPIGTNSACTDLGETCQENVKQCTGSYVSGKCAGPENIKCCTGNITLQDTKSCKNVPVYSRDTWGARSPLSFEPLPVPVGMFFIHHTAGPSCTTSERCAAILRGIQRFHMETRKWDDIAYSFLVGEDGRIYEGRGWKRVGSHTKGYNSKSLAVSVMGNFSSITPNTAALDAVRSLLTCAVEAGYLKKDYSLYGHRDVRPTECPGDAFYGLIRSWQHYNTTTDKDQGCVSQHGICQPTYLPCVGYFKTGLCNGYSKRQCCIRE